MNINQVKTCKKVGQFALEDLGKKNHIKIIYAKMEPKILSSNLARVYIFTLNNKIVKIGGSCAKGGIKNTIRSYTTAMTGSPGGSRFTVHLQIWEWLKANKDVEVYMITSPSVTSRVSGLFGIDKMSISSYKEMETKCKEDYRKSEGKYPVLNVKEKAESYDLSFAMEHNEYQRKRLSKG